MTHATSARRVVRNRKRTPARTAHIEYQAAGLDLHGRRVRAAYHAITNQKLTIGYRTRYSGDALCGAPGPWADIPDGLFPPLVTCRACQHITTRLHITITGGMP
jgi:hypothetical protein